METSAVDSGSQTLTFMVSLAVLIGIFTAYLLYRAAHLKKEMNVNVLDVQKISVDTSAVPSKIREKVQRLPMKIDDRENAVRQISQIVEEETQALLQEIKQEYSVKYQVVVQEKNKEIEQTKLEADQVRHQYQEVREAYKEVDEQKKQTEAVVRSIADGVVVVNQKGEVLLMNPSAERILGVQKERKIGRSIMDDIGNELMVSLSRDGGEGEKVIEYRTKDENVKKVLKASSAVIQNESGQTVGMLNVLTDVTKQRELDELKKSFVSNITHEFRTPIVAMQKAASLLLNHSAGTLNDTQENFLNIVARNLGHLSRLVEDLLDVAKIESGKMRIKPVQGRLDKTIYECCDTLDTWAKSKNIQIVRDVEKNMPEFSFDPVKITQVLNNLISNAIKFTPSGGTITVKAEWSRDGKQVTISISDTGVGISKENLAKLFRRFEQFGDQTGISGTGLGLVITKEIVERHGGVVSVDSLEKKGTTFTFTLLTKPHIIGG